MCLPYTHVILIRKPRPSRVELSYRGPKVRDQAGGREVHAQGSSQGRKRLGLWRGFRTVIPPVLSIGVAKHSTDDRVPPQGFPFTWSERQPAHQNLDNTQDILICGLSRELLI